MLKMPKTKLGLAMYRLHCQSKFVNHIQLFDKHFLIYWFMLVQGTSAVVGVEPITIMIIIIVIIKDSFDSHNPLCTSPRSH